MLGTQIRETFAGVQKSWLKNIVVAYEPVWAISSTVNHKDVTAEEVHEASLFIRKVLADMFGQKESASVRIIYGGSANSKNAYGILSKGNVAGLLPGKASLNVKEFTKMLEIANTIK
jgi:triosephosphate isomerase